MVYLSKIEAAEIRVSPTNVLMVKSLVCLVSYYHRFVKGFTSIASQMNYLTKLNIPFVWINECE